MTQKVTEADHSMVHEASEALVQPLLIFLNQSSLTLWLVAAAGCCWLLPLLPLLLLHPPTMQPQPTRATRKAHLTVALAPCHYRHSFVICCCCCCCCCRFFLCSFMCLLFFYLSMQRPIERSHSSCCDASHHKDVWKAFGH